jgi:ankyrin repeat protein
VEAGVDPGAKDKISQTPIYYTAREGKYQCSLYLLDLGCPLDEKDLYQQTPIYYAAR